MFKNAKFESTGETKIVAGRTLHQIRAVVAIAAFGISVGDVGGWIEKEPNLSVSGNAWVYGDAQVYGNTWVSGNARVSGDAQVYGDARLKTVIIVATRSDNYTFLVTPTPQGPRIIAGCRYFTFEEARQHWQSTRGNTQLGEESLALVDHLERMAILNGFIDPVTE